MRALIFFLVASASADDIRGRHSVEAGVTQYNFQYGEVPARFAPAKWFPFTTDARKESVKCPQVHCENCGFRPPKIDPTKEYKEGAPQTRGSEQCLWLSVFAGDKGGTNPVVFHVHHGHLVYGFKTEMDDVKNVVNKGVTVANANFRLGAFGFLPHPDLDQVNVGQQDLLLALGWIQRHVSRLGGDPGRVTLTGSSSGASQALLAMASSKSSGLFTRAWINSVTGYGNPDFFSSDVPTVWESETHRRIKSIGCGNLECVKQMSTYKFLTGMVDSGSGLAAMDRDIIESQIAKPSFAYDGVIIPNMLKAACNNQMASNSHIPMVVGHSKDELDTLKFQFDPFKTVRNYLQHTTKGTGYAAKENVDCFENTFMKEGIQESAEDMMFSVGSYIAGTKAGGAGPRWHFLVTAPASVSKRAWHTSAELLSWGPDLESSTEQSHETMKRYVLGKASQELRTYSVDNFVKFIGYGAPRDMSWKQTAAIGGGIGGVPSKLWDNEPLKSDSHRNEHHHSSLSVRSLHAMICKKPELLHMKVQHCTQKKLPANNITGLQELHHRLSVLKKSDIVFGLEMMKGTYELPYDKA